MDGNMEGFNPQPPRSRHVEKSISTTERIRGRHLKEVVNDLIRENKKMGKRDVLKHPREYYVSEVNPESLKMMAALPYECGLGRYDNQLTLFTGAKKAITPKYPKTVQNPYYQESRWLKRGHFTLHNHPSGRGSISNGDFHVNYDSSGGNNEIAFVTTSRGITCYKIGDAEYAKSPGRLDENYPESLLDIVSDRIAIARQLRMGVIKAWIKWDDPRAHLLCEYMNGRKTWKDIKHIIETPRWMLPSLYPEYT